MLKNTLSLLLFCLFLLPIHGISYGQDSTAFNPTTVVVEAKGTGGVPVGTIVAWPVATNPSDWDNWLECNGQTIDPAVYPALRSLIGANVPDLRGLFLRGHGGNSAALGIQQGDAIRNITGKLNMDALSLIYLWDQTSGVFKITTGGSAKSSTYYAHDRGCIDFDASRVVPTAEENRPVNMAVRYLIRALP